ncbi:MAG TPA: Crp/Fnr family transcriptional regulator [Bacteroidales bacterium]|nr:Crp/Fnr family transcriptional regulator [Bacteroidales bacterium]
MSSNLIDNCENCTANWEHFRNLTTDELNLINENRYEAAFRTGEIMIKQGSPASHALFIASGMAKVYVEGINGRNCMLGIALPGELIMSPGAYLNSRHSYSVASLTNARACFISIAILKQVVRTNGAFAEGMLMDMSEKFNMTNQKLVSQAQKRMSGRLAEILLYLSDNVYHSDEYHMILSRQELGEMASMAKECVVRILKEFEDSGIIDSNSSGIRILDREELIKISERG